MPRKKRRADGAVPAAPPPDESVREAVVMFVDIMGASEVANHKGPAEYARFVNSFQKLFLAVCEEYMDAWYDDQRDWYQYSVSGDEGLLMLYASGTEGEPSTDVDVAINIAIELKRRWLCMPENRDRVTEAGLLPIDLGIGVHAGKVHLEKQEPRRGNPGGYKLEGYTINLAKRIEGHSRQGHYTHIYASEAAHGHLNRLADERLYFFDRAETIVPKGISRQVRVYEVKHHFLPTDWMDEIDETELPRKSRTLLKPDSADLETIAKAIQIIPTNYWLSEEFIRTSRLIEYVKMTPQQREDTNALRAAFRAAQEQAETMAESDQRDAGALFVLGQILGECEYYAEEQARYLEALDLTDQLAEAHWYLGLSHSYKVDDALERDVSRPYKDLDAATKQGADSAIEHLRTSRFKRRQSAWMLYDYGCELIRWERSEDEKAEGLESIVLAATYLPIVGEHIRRERYLQKVLEDVRIKPLLSRE